MYMVVSYWEAMPGKQAEFERTGQEMRELLCQLPGVTMVESFKSDGEYVVIHAYRDEAAYHAVVDNPDSAFARAMERHHVEEVGRWIRSERGETLPPG